MSRPAYRPPAFPWAACGLAALVCRRPPVTEHTVSRRGRLLALKEEPGP